MRLVELLASLRVEATPEAHFEERFLCEFHERVAREAVCRPARQHVWSHMMQMLENFGRRRVACGASTLGLGFLAVGWLSLPTEELEAAVAAEAPLSSLSQPLDYGDGMLIPSLRSDVDDCTCVRVEVVDNPYGSQEVLVSGSRGFLPSFQSGRSFAPSYPQGGASLGGFSSF